MHLLYMVYTNNGSRTDFVHIPEGDKEKKLHSLYEKLYGKAYAYGKDMVWRSSNNRWDMPIVAELKEKLMPDCFLDSDSRMSYKRRGLKKELTDIQYEIEVGSKRNSKKETVYPTQMAVGLSQKEWDLLYDLWDEWDYGNPEGKTAHFKKKEKRYLKLIEIVKSNDFVNDMVVCDIII